MTYEDNSEGICTTGKIRYADEQQAAIALERVRRKRAADPDRDRAPERVFYQCRFCQGYHLTSQAPPPGPPPAAKGDGETWEEYAHRLERRIKEQRDQLEAVNKLRIDAGNKHQRQRLEQAERALARMTVRWEHERDCRAGLVERLRDAAASRIEEDALGLLAPPAAAALRREAARSGRPIRGLVKDALYAASAHVILAEHPELAEQQV